MIAAPDLDGIKHRVESLEEPWRVVSLLFAEPDSLAMAQLEASMNELDTLTGDSWDLFFPGYYRYVPDDLLPPRQERRTLPAEDGPVPWEYINRNSTRLQMWVREMSGINFESSGRGDLVSFIAYNPWHVDVESFTVVPEILTQRSSLIEVAQGLVGWPADDVDPGLAPGQVEAGRFDIRLAAVAALTVVAQPAVERLLELAVRSA